MKKYQYFILGLILAVGGTAMAAVFNSSQVGTNPVNNYYLQTNGSTSSWQPVSATGGSGTVSTSTVPTVGQIPYWTSNGYPSLLGSTATTSATWYQDEVLSRTDGTNYTLAHTPTAVVFLYLNGQLLPATGNYTRTGTAIALTSPTIASDTVSATYS